MNTFWQDIRYTFRTMRKKPAFAIFAVLTLALGIGVNTVVFSIANAVLLRPLPAKDPSALIRLYQKTGEGAVQQRFSYPNYADLRDRNSSLEGLAAVALVPFRLELQNESRQILVEAVSGNYFQVLQIQPEYGRTISIQDDMTGARPVALLSFRLWQQHFGGADNAGATTARLNGITYDVVGAMPATFTGTFAGARIDAWVPLSSSQSMINSLRDRSKSSVHLLGRLKQNVTIHQTNAELSSIFTNLSKAYPDANQGKTISTGAATLLHGRLRKGASFFFGVVLVLMGLVLFIACSNLAGMLVTRALERRREMAIRISIGANRRQLLFQMFTESVVIALLGGIAGLLIAVWFTNFIVSFWPVPTVPIAFNFAPDARVFLFCFGISMITGILMGLAPAMQSNQNDVVTALKEQTSGSLFQRVRLKSALVVIQVSLSLLLLICAALFVRSWLNAERLDPGFDSNNVLAMDLDLGDKGFTPEQSQRYFDQLLQRVRSLPRIVSASYADLAPMDLATGRTAAKIAGHAPPAGLDSISISSNRIDAGYFQAMKIPVQRGREFNEQDRTDSVFAVIINETMANRYWPDQDPLGKSIQIERTNKAFQPATIIGIVKDVRYRTPAEEPTPHIYLSFRQMNEQSMSLLVRTQGEPKAFVPQIEKEISMLHKDVQAFFARSMQEHLAFSLLPSKFGGTLLAFFGLLGLLLASIGIYAAISFQVAQRKKEIGIRMAVGASPAAILRLFISRGLRLTAGGAVAGIAAALLVTRLLSSLLVGVGTNDLLTFLAVPAFLLLVSFIACAIPAYRASKLDPLKSLRFE